MYTLFSLIVFFFFGLIDSRLFTVKGISAVHGSVIG